MSMHAYKVLYEDGNNVRRLVDVELPDAFKVIGIQRYTDFETKKEAQLEPNGTYPVIDADTFNDLYGKLLTLCDATFADATQREAFKDVVKSTLSRWYGGNTDYILTMTERLSK